MKSARKQMISEHKVQFMDNKGRPLLAKKYPRNLQCWCGSGKKCKNCCGNETKYWQPKVKEGGFLDVVKEQENKAETVM